MGDLGKLIAAKGFEKLPEVQKSPNLVTLATMDNVGSPLHTGNYLGYFDKL